MDVHDDEIEDAEVQWLNEESFEPETAISSPGSQNGCKQSHASKGSKGSSARARRGARFLGSGGNFSLHGLGGLQSSAEAAAHFGLTGKNLGTVNADFFGRALRTPLGTKTEPRAEAAFEGGLSFQAVCVHEVERLLDTILRSHASETASLVSRLNLLEMQNKGQKAEHEKRLEQLNKGEGTGSVDVVEPYHRSTPVDAFVRQKEQPLVINGHATKDSSDASARKETSAAEEPAPEIPGALPPVGRAFGHEPLKAAGLTAPVQAEEKNDSSQVASVGFRKVSESHALPDIAEFLGDDQQDYFELWEAWTKRETDEKSKKNKSNYHKAVTSHPEHIGKLVLKGDFGSNDDLDLEDEDAAEIREQRDRCSCFDTIVIRQTNPFRLGFWDPASFVLVAYECIYIPLQFFELREGDFQKIQQWISRIFWSIDLVLSFITGYQSADGQMVMKPSSIIKKYIKSWFFIDVSLVVLDWMEVFLGNIENLGAARIGKTVKVLRLLRMLRVARIIQTLRLPESLSSLMFLLRSEVLGVVMGIMKIVLFVLILNHFLACIWYGLAHGQDAPNWITEHNINGHSFWYKYWTSYHWSLSQFAGTMEVGPHNIQERAFAVGVMLLAFFIAAAVISNITSAFTRLEIVTASQNTRLILLRQFLVDNQVTRKLAMRIVKSAQLSLEEQKRHTPEQSIDLLTMISEPLKLELHHEIYGPRLDAHPFLRRYMQVCPKTMHRVCHVTLSHISLSAGDILFAAGEFAPSPHMYFTLDGKVIYVQGKIFTPLKHPKYFCEVQLWTPWMHQGTAVAKKNSSLMGLSADKFQEVVTSAPFGDYELALKYGKAYVEALNGMEDEDLTDLDNPFFFNAKKWVNVNLPYDEDQPVAPMLPAWHAAVTGDAGGWPWGGVAERTTKSLHDLGKVLGVSGYNDSADPRSNLRSTFGWCPCCKKREPTKAWPEDGIAVLAS